MVFRGNHTPIVSSFFEKFLEKVKNFFEAFEDKNKGYWV